MRRTYEEIDGMHGGSSRLCHSVCIGDFLHGSKIDRIYGILRRENYQKNSGRDTGYGFGGIGRSLFYHLFPIVCVLGRKIFPCRFDTEIGGYGIGGVSMDRTVAIIIETVFTAIIIIFLLSYLLHGRINGKEGILNSFYPAYEEIQVQETMDMGSLFAQNLSGEKKPPVQKTAFVSVNQTYHLMDMFENVKSIKLVEARRTNGEAVLAEGDIDILSGEEMPAAVLYDAGSGALMFTKSGTYRMTLRLRTVTDRKNLQEVYMTITALSDLF